MVVAVVAAVVVVVVVVVGIDIEDAFTMFP